MQVRGFLGLKSETWGARPPGIMDRDGQMGLGPPPRLCGSNGEGSVRNMARAEDRPRTLIFVDILGFAEITKNYQFRVRDSGPDELGFTHSSTTEMPNRINRFNTVLDQCVFEETSRGGIQAMLFSDCAFLVFEASLRATVVGASLMRDLIKRGVPVRMGIGKGTFYNIEYVTNTNVGSVTVSKSRFIGTAVARAHAAEQCGGKGMRIFLDASIEEDLPSICRRIKTLRLAKPFGNVKWELDYLHESGPASERPKIEAADRELFEKVAYLKSPGWTANARRHYTQTLAAMNRMREANSRSPVNLRKLKCGGSADIMW